MKICCACLVLCIGLSWSLIATANPTVGIEIWEAIQQGQAVEIVVSPNNDHVDALTVERITDFGAKIIAEQVKTDEISTESYCFAADVDPDYCAENSGDCFDCDEDSIEECRGLCEDVVLFVDDCVPVGEARYNLYYHEEHGCNTADHVIVDALDVGQDCDPGDDAFECDSDLDVDMDADTDADNDADTDTDTDTDSDADTDTDGDEGTDDTGTEDASSSGDSGCAVITGRHQQRSFWAILFAAF
jgi:hypothetical protein